MKVTVFTPTYNRAYILNNLYESLERQSYKNFEWIIIDDGSVDNTKELVEKWKKDCSAFSIRYYYQENGGKCRAINKALDLAKGELFFTVDSDDYLTDDALEKIVKWEQELDKNKLYCGFAGNLGTSANSTPNSNVGTPYYEGTALNRYKNVDGERAMVFYTDVHRKYKYPEFSDEKFMTEAIAWNRMAADGYNIRFYNDIIWIYEYREDGLTKAGNTLFINSPYGYGLWLREKAEFEGISILEKFKMYYTFTCDLASKYDTKLIAESIGTFRLVVILAKLMHRALAIVRGRKRVI